MGYGSFSILGFFFGIISIMICLGGIRVTRDRVTKGLGHDATNNCPMP